MQKHYDGGGLHPRVKVISHPFTGRQLLCLGVKKSEFSPEDWERVKACVRTNGSRMFAWSQGLNCFVGYALDDETLGKAVAIARKADAGASTATAKTAATFDASKIAAIAEAGF